MNQDFGIRFFMELSYMILDEPGADNALPNLTTMRLALGISSSKCITECS
jgi:hypothetical protein